MEMPGQDSSPQGDEKLTEELMSTRSGLSIDDVKKRIDEKEKEFEGLVSKEGAMYIISKELGIEVSKPRQKGIKIKDIVENLRQVKITAKVLQISAVREFSKPNRKGKVQNMTVGDETGTINISIWNDDTEKISVISANDTVEISNCYSKKGYFGKTELVFNDRSTIEKTDKEIDAKVTDTHPGNQASNKRTVEHIDDAEDNTRLKVRACFTSIFDRNMIHDICPKCRKKIAEKGRCKVHGDISPDKFLVLSGNIDDGLGNINAVAFNKEVERLIGKDKETIEKDMKGVSTREYLESEDLLVKDFLLEGDVKTNSFTGKQELLIRVVEEINTDTEIKKMKETMEV